MYPVSVKAFLLFYQMICAVTAVGHVDWLSVIFDEITINGL